VLKLLDLSMAYRLLHDDLRKIYLHLKAPSFDLHRPTRSSFPPLAPLPPLSPSLFVSLSAFLSCSHSRSAPLLIRSFNQVADHNHPNAETKPNASHHFRSSAIGPRDLSWCAIADLRNVGWLACWTGGGRRPPPAAAGGGRGGGRGRSGHRRHRRDKCRISCASGIMSSMRCGRLLGVH
jgi:hypothetical protein